MRFPAIEAGMGTSRIAKLLGLHLRSESHWLTKWHWNVQHFKRFKVS
jgi:hypothetical protein